MSILIKNLPEDIKKVAIKRVIEYRNKHKDSKFDKDILDETVSSGFSWASTIEDEYTISNIWCDVDCGIYESFYKFHKINPNKTNNLFNKNFY